MFMIALGIAMFSNLARGQYRFQFPPLLLVYMLFLSWITVSTFLAYDTNTAWHVYKDFLPSMWVAPIFLFATIRDLKLLKWVMWVAAGGIAINAFKVAAVLTASGGGHVTDQISGFVGDNNVFGLVLCLVVAILMGLRTTLPTKKWVRTAFYVFIAFVVLCIIYTKSRGAFASLGVILLLGSIFSRRPVRHTLLFIVVTMAGYAFLPSDYFERLSTVENLSEDASAMGRFENWELSWNEALEYPFTGVGPENHIPYNNHVVKPAVHVRVAHSVYFQVLGELGFVGLVLYILYILMGLKILVKTWRFSRHVVKTNPDLVWVRDTAFWMACGYAGYILGSGLLNMLYIEFPWYAMFYGSMLLPLLHRELGNRQNILSAEKNNKKSVLISR
jgi:putative inorganic carbon (HCO3(-)) transporter